MISLTADVKASPERLRSRTCVAPRDLSKGAFLSEAVVMMGEKLERRASWIADNSSQGKHRSVAHQRKEEERSAPGWEMAAEPPKMRIG